MEYPRKNSLPPQIWDPEKVTSVTHWMAEKFLGWKSWKYTVLGAGGKLITRRYLSEATLLGNSPSRYRGKLLAASCCWMPCTGEGSWASGACYWQSCTQCGKWVPRKPCAPQEPGIGEAVSAMGASAGGAAHAPEGCWRSIPKTGRNSL